MTALARALKSAGYQPAADRIADAATRAIRDNPRDWDAAWRTFRDAVWADPEMTREASVAGQVMQHNGLTALRHILQDAAPPGRQVDDEPTGKITAEGLEIVRGRKDQALRAALMAGDLDPTDLLMLMTLAWLADNVDVRGLDAGGRQDFHRIAARLLGPDGNLHADLDAGVINACARTALTLVLRVSGKGLYQHAPSGDAAEWVGRLLGADAHLPRFDDETFLATCRGDTLKAMAEAAQVTWSGGVAAMRRRLAGQAADWRPPQATFGAAAFFSTGTAGHE